MKKPLHFEPGTMFGIVKVLEFAGKDARNNRLFRCQCQCGKIMVVPGTKLKKIKSCSCRNGITHGEGSVSTITKELRAHRHMIDRCYNQNDPDYKIWGGRGIRVCARWLESYKNFLDDVGRAPTPKHTIDRYPNPSGNYEPGNVRWATLKEQQGNRTNNIWLEGFGKKMILADWARELSMDQSVISFHLKKGRSLEYIKLNSKHHVASTQS